MREVSIFSTYYQRANKHIQHQMISLGECCFSTDASQANENDMINILVKFWSCCELQKTELKYEM